MPRQSVWFIRTSLLYLGLGFTFGALMLMNKGFPLAPILWRLLPSHVEILLMGWVVELAMGVAYYVLPRFPTDAPRGNTRLVWVAYALFNIGVLTVITGSWLNAGDILLLLGRSMEAAGVALFVSQAWGRVKPIDMPAPR